MDPRKLKIGTILRADGNFVMQRVIKISELKWKVLANIPGDHNTRLRIGQIVDDHFFSSSYSIDLESIVDMILTKYQDG